MGGALGHPAASRVFRRHLEDAWDEGDFYMNYDDGVSCGYDNNEYTTSCEMDDNGSLVCTVCLADGTYCVKEQCDYNMDDDAFSMTCTSCATRSEGGDEDYDFCVSITCDLNKAISNGAGNLEDYCDCDSASLNGNQCSKCELCSTDDIDYSAQDWSSNTGSVSTGLDLQCPDMYLLEAEQDIATCPAKKSTAAKSAIWAVPVGLGVIAVAAGSYYYFYHHKQKKDDKKEKLVDISEKSKAEDGIMT